MGDKKKKKGFFQRREEELDGIYAFQNQNVVPPKEAEAPVPEDEFPNLRGGRKKKR